MKKMCFGSFATVLSKCRAPSITQKELIGRMLLVVNPNYDITTDDVAVSALVRGKNNLSDEVTLYLDEPSSSFPTAFAGTTVSMLDANKKSNIVLAFKDILKEDTDIADDTVIELVNQITKVDFITRDSIVFNDMIAGLFLYVAKYTDNHNRKKFIDEITDSYIRRFDARRNEITWIPSYVLKNEGEIKTVAANAHVMELMAESEGKCPRCGKILSAENSTVVPVGNGEDMLLCLECCAMVQNLPDIEKVMTDLKEGLRRSFQTTEAVSANKLLDEVKELLINLKNVSADGIQLKTLPIRVEQKVSDQLLSRKIRGYILDGMYDGVNACIEQLAAENRLNILKLSKCVRRMFEDASEESETQEEVFYAITDSIYRQSGHVSRSACELLVSYFVQRCEVFNEIAGENNAI